MTTAISTEVLEEGDLGLLPEDMQPPRLRFSGKKGTFSFVGDDSEAMETITAVPLLQLQRTRVKFSEADDSSEIECRSEDYLMPVSSEQAAAIGAGPTCLTCPFHLFRKDPRSSDTLPPLCTEFRNVIFASLPENESEEPMPFLFSVKSLSIKTLIQALNAIQHRRKKVPRGQPPKPGYAFAVTMQAGPEKRRGRMSWYPLEIEVAEAPVPNEILPLYADLWRGAVELSQRIVLTADSSDQSPAFDENGEPISG